MPDVGPFEEIIYDKHHRVRGAAWVTINRPHRMNSTTQQTWAEIIEAVEDADADPDIGVIVLTGAGERAFCAGGDVGQHPDKKQKPGEFKHLGIRHGGIEDTTKPVIARVCGYAIGGGNHLAYHCDLTIACDDHAIFGQNGPRVAAPNAGHFVQTAAYTIGLKRAKEMWMLCHRYSGAEAVELGLANVSIPHAELDDKVDEWCQELIERSPTSLALLKRLFREVYSHHRDVDALGFINEVNPEFFEDGGEAKEGKEAFLEKRAPDFSPFRGNISGSLRRDRLADQDG